MAWPSAGLCRRHCAMKIGSGMLLSDISSSSLTFPAMSHSDAVFQLGGLAVSSPPYPVEPTMTTAWSSAIRSQPEEFSDCILGNETCHREHIATVL